MAADFETYSYVADAGAVHPIRTSTETALAQPTAIVGIPKTSSISARVGGSSRVRGLRARGFRLKRTTGVGVAKKSFYTFLPIFAAADYNAGVIDADITVDGIVWKISRKVAEISS